MVTLLILASFLLTINTSWAQSATASASVLIIVPPMDERGGDKLAKEEEAIKTQEVKVSEEKQVAYLDEAKKE